MSEPKFCVVCGDPLGKYKQTLCGSEICKSEQKRRNSQNYRNRRSGKPIWVPKSIRNALTKKKPKIPKVPRKILNPIILECQFCSFQITIENVYKTPTQGEFTCKRCLELERQGKDGDLSELMSKRKAKYLEEKEKWIREKAKREKNHTISTISPYQIGEKIE